MTDQKNLYVPENMHDAHVHAIEEIGGGRAECLACHASLVGIARPCKKEDDSYKIRTCAGRAQPLSRRSP